jgi:SAM-dependent methyltransferase
MFEYFQDQLQVIECKIPTTPPAEIPALFEGLPLDIFARLLLDVPIAYPNIRAFLPAMATEEVQRNWTGADSYALMVQSVAAIRTIVSRYEQLTARNIRDAAVLDFGCGWGRLTRLLYKYTSTENLYGVDPWDSSLEECGRQGLRIQIAKSEEVPTRLPFDRKFDLIFAFSIFTHLSERTAHAVMKALRLGIFDHGILLITIRPIEYWHFADREKADPTILEQHATKGFAFRPHERAPIGDEVTYGDTSMTLDYIKKNFSEWEIAGVDWSMSDPFQIFVSLRPELPMKAVLKEYRPVCEAAALRLGTVADIHPEDLIFRFLWKNRNFATKELAIYYYFDDGAKSAEQLRGLLSGVCNFGGRPIELFEFASGFGCLTRHISKTMPACKLVSCDIHPTAVQFLRERLGVEAMQSANIPEELDPGRTFDVVFALSFFSHMPKTTFLRWMQKLASLVKSGGFLIFTTHGHISRDTVLPLCQLDDEGFYFQMDSEQKDLDAAEYGTTIVSPKYVFDRALAIPNCRLHYFQEGFWWGHQDLYIFRVADPKLTAVSS